MNIILFDDAQWRHLLPLTFTRPQAALRVGIFTIAEKWQKHLNAQVSYHTQAYLWQKFAARYTEENLLIWGSLCPDAELLQAITALQTGECLRAGDRLLAARVSEEQAVTFDPEKFDTCNYVAYKQAYTAICYPWDIFSLNAQEIERDFHLITAGRVSAPLSATNRVLHAERIFAEPSAKCEFAILNPDKGYIYLGADSEIMEGSMVRGSLALCEHAQLKMGAKIYGASTFGPYCKVGGEVNNSVIMGYSSKAHDGFLGNSVLGEWCNLGADTNNSNLKNNYAEVRVWSYVKESFVPTGLQFCGLIMGDHSKSGINTMFNTGTVVGVCANIFGSGFPRAFVPSYSWGGAAGFTVYQIKKAFEVAELVMARRHLELDITERFILNQVFEDTAKNRRF